MDDREKIILDTFADWSKKCKQGYTDLYENPIKESHVSQLKLKASKAYIAYRDIHGLKKSTERKFAQEKFLEAAREAFSFKLHYGDSLYEIGAARVNRHNSKWQSINSALDKSESISGLIDSLEFGSEERKTLKETLSQGDYKDNLNDLGRLKLNLSTIQKHEYEKKFGSEKVFAEVGRYYAEMFFSQLNPTIGRPPKSFNNLDTVRAFQFSSIVVIINKKLSDKSYMPSNLKEVCELTFGKKNRLGLYSRESEIDWALREYFHIKNITVRAFLNSISRGKNKLSKISGSDD